MNDDKDKDANDLYIKFLNRFESRVVKSWANSWFLFCARWICYGLAIFICTSTLLLYLRKQISSTDFGYIMPLSAMSSAALICASSQFCPEKKSDILFDLSLDLISDFLPSHKATYRTRS